MTRLLLAFTLGALTFLQAQNPPAPPAPAVDPRPPARLFDEDMVRAKIAAAADQLDWIRVPPFEYELDRAKSALAAQSFELDRMRKFEFAPLGDEMIHAKMALDDLSFNLHRMGPDLAFFQNPIPQPPSAPPPPAMSMGKDRRQQDEESIYRSGKGELERRDWDDAIERFQTLIDKKGRRADASLYWKAYAQHKQGRKSEALATLAELQRTYASSRWLDDAKALELEVKQSSGQPVSPESEVDEEIKLLALQGMIHSDPERSVPVIEKLLQRSPSPRLKERALFVLAQSRSPLARTLLLNVAKGSSGNPDLQARAIEYLGMQNTPENRQALVEIYAANNDVTIRRSVIRGLSAARDKERLLAAAKTESNPELRREAIRGLGSANASEELWQLYAAESSPELKVEILRAMPDRKENADKVVEYVKSESDQSVRAELIRQIGYMKYPATRDLLPQLYSTTTDLKVKASIINSLRGHNNATALVAIAKSETDPKMKRYVVEVLSNMKNKEATDYLMDMLNK